MPHTMHPGPHALRAKKSVTRRAIQRVRVVGGSVERAETRDALATEEPLEIRVAHPARTAVTTSVTMRTPGADFELASGYLYAESVLESRRDVLAIRYCSDGAQRYNRVTVHLAPGAPPLDLAPRSAYTTSACGVCGKASIDEVLSLGCPPVSGGLRLACETLLALPRALRAEQKLFDSTGGLHAAALFDADGRLLRLREDVGRHNAMDKLVGASLLAGELPLRGKVLLVSGRLSFELVQKAARAGAEILAGVSAPSSLAVELADRVGMTLVGFLRAESFNVYSGAERIG